MTKIKLEGIGLPAESYLNDGYKSSISAHDNTGSYTNRASRKSSKVGFDSDIMHGLCHFLKNITDMTVINILRRPLLIIISCYLDEYC